MKLELLIDQMIATTATMGYTEKTWKHAIRNGRFSSMRTFFAQKGEVDFSISLAHEYIVEMQKKYESGKISYYRYSHLRKMAFWLIELCETGAIQWMHHRKSKIIVNPFFERVLFAYLDIKADTLSPGNIVGQKSAILHFLGFLQKKEYDDFSSLKRQDLQDFILDTRLRRPGRIDQVVYSTKYFVLYLKEQNYIDDDLASALSLPTQRPRKILPGFTHEEVRIILSQPDRSTSIGKRDYAILMLGKNTGLRRGDIVGMHLTDIDWQNDELLISQGKTGRPLRLPLEVDTENAILDYLQNGRPKFAGSNLFLRGMAPYLPLTPQSVGSRFSKYLKSTGILHTPKDGKSFHGLRRSIARWMLDADVPLTTISQTLGHQKINSTHPYLSMDEKNLRKCALSLQGLECCKEGLS